MRFQLPGDRHDLVAGDEFPPPNPGQGQPDLKDTVTCGRTLGSPGPCVWVCRAGEGVGHLPVSARETSIPFLNWVVWGVVLYVF